MALPVGRIVHAAYASVLEDSGAFVSIALPWFALGYVVRYIIPLDLLVPLATFDRMLSVAVLTAILSAGALLVIHAAFAAAWTRWVLLREPAPHGLVPRIGPRELRCAGVVLAIGLISGAAALPMLGIALISAPIGIAAAVVAMAYVMLRFALAVPMAALDAPAGVLRASWGVTIGTTFGLLILTIVVLLPVGLLELAVGFLAGRSRASRTDMAWYVLGLLESVIAMLTSAVVASTYAFAFAAIADGPQDHPSTTHQQ